MFNVQLILWLCALLLAACGEGHEQMLQQLEELERQNRADSVMTNDSLAEALTRYFDRHGTPNERMRAHYILGRTYADMGEAPAALNAYLDAADCADTTATDCDYRTLSRVHAQSAIIYHRLVQPMGQLEELRLAQYYAWRGNDTLIAIQTYAQSSEPYAMRQQFDSAIYIREKAYQMYMTIGKSNWAAITLGGAITAALKLNDIERVKHYINVYETSSGLFNNGSIQKGRELYYYLKGEYYIVVNKLDSAEYQFRRLQGTGYTLNDQIAVCQGLQDLYKRLGNTDSVAKYAERCYQLNDSAYSLSEMENIQRLKASYNYNRFQKQAFESEKKADRERLHLYILLIVAFLLALIGITAFILFKKRKLKAIHQLTGALTVSRAEQQNVKQELEKLKSKNYDELIIEKERKEQELELRIATLEQEIGQSEGAKPQNRFADFKNSQIVNVFGKKAHFTKDHPVPNKSEWNALVGQFREDMPATYQFFFDGKKLSPLELYTCILLLLDFEEGTIVGLTQSSSTTLSNAKSRANQKLFNEKSAVTLKYNLKSII